MNALRRRVLLKSPVRKIRTPGTVRGLLGNWQSYRNYDHFSFDLQVRYALGIWDLNESDFDLRTLYYFRERLSQYNLEHGINLLNQAFEEITDQQITVLKI